MASSTAVTSTLVTPTMSQFKHIGVFGRRHNDQVVETAQRVLQYLGDAGYQVLVHHVIAEAIPFYQGETGRRHDIAKQCDLAIVIGGDGSMLAAAREMALEDVPVVGVNRGKLGFLTDIVPDNVEHSLAKVLAGEYETSSRFMLSAIVLRDGKEVAQGSGLNDLVLHPSQSNKMLTYKLTIDDKTIFNQRADGLIVATPTGSTAYALSAGGPIMHPDIDAIALVPMHAHDLSARPVVVSADAVLHLHLGMEDHVPPIISFDGQVQVPCQPGDIIQLQRHACRLRVLHPVGYSFYQRCVSKLGWHAASG